MSTTTPPPDSELHFQVVIAGGGFAGVYCARELARQLGPKSRDKVALIADENFMVFQPMLPEIAGSALAPRHVVNPIRRLCPHTTVLRAKILKIDGRAKTLLIETGGQNHTATVTYEHLVLCTGGIVDLSRVPGMPEHAYLMKNVGDALKLRAAVIDRFEEANLEAEKECQQKLLTFVIVGGGYSGVETAGQLLDLAKEMVHAYSRISADKLRVVLIHSGPHLLPELNRELGQYTEDTLRARGVEIILDTRVTAMTASRVILADGRVIPSFTVVSTVGNAPNPVIVDLCRADVLTCEKGRILVEPTLQVRGQASLWAAGDCAAVPMDLPEDAKRKGDLATASEKGGSPFTPRQYCPPTAQFAMRQGKLLARNLVAKITGVGSVEPFTFTGLGELASIGHRAAVAEVFGFRFRGFFAWWLWRSIYLMKLPGLERKLRVMVDWTLDLFFPRDIAVFQPKPTGLMREMHLEKDDILFQAGEPARSLYLVQAGHVKMLDANGQMLRRLGPGDQIGRETLTHGKVWQYTIVADEPVLLVAISGKVFKALNRPGTAAPETVLKRDQPAAPAAELAPETVSS